MPVLGTCRHPGLLLSTELHRATIANPFRPPACRLLSIFPCSWGVFLFVYKVPQLRPSIIDSLAWIFLSPVCGLRPVNLCSVSVKDTRDHGLVRAFRGTWMCKRVFGPCSSIILTTICFIVNNLTSSFIFNSIAQPSLPMEAVMPTPPCPALRSPFSARVQLHHRFPCTQVRLTVYSLETIPSLIRFCG